MTKKEYKTGEHKPSEMFMDSMAEGGIGSDEMECGWCGRQHLCPDSEYYSRDGGAEEGDNHRKYCEEEYKKNPEGVVLHHDCDGITGRYLNAVLFVLECPCNGLHRYEVFIWENKKTIRNYLKERIEYEFQLAQQELTLNKLAGIS